MGPTNRRQTRRRANHARAAPSAGPDRQSPKIAPGGHLATQRASGPHRNAQLVPSVMHARRALPDQSAALLADLAPRRGRRFPLNAVVRARLAITASREAEATHPTRARSGGSTPISVAHRSRLATSAREEHMFRLRVQRNRSNAIQATTSQAKGKPSASRALQDITSPRPGPSSVSCAARARSPCLARPSACSALLGTTARAAIPLRPIAACVMPSGVCAVRPTQSSHHSTSRVATGATRT
mmetsp:Transcript_15183/g.45529  ORF Transcript_15183/g.45529 Transcript_15183/m.45529 type:complete len:242 (-) Transcript_15183:1023-1748(-)